MNVDKNLLLKFLISVVFDFGFMDNNRVHVKMEDSGEVIPYVAEWCDIVVRVEDK